MPLDKAGKYHMNPHHAKASDAQASKPGNEPQPGPDGMAGGKGGGKDLSAGIPTPSIPSAPSGLTAPKMGGGGQSPSAPTPSTLSVPESAPMQHPAHEAADQMSEHMASMDPADLADLKTRLESVLQEITDLLGGGQQSQGATSAPVLGGY